jgi:glycogen debranching enzyme
MIEDHSARPCDFTRASRLEWLETSGNGTYAMGTVSGAATRRYHALLVAALRPPVERRVLLARVEESVEGHELATNQYPGCVHPQGYRKLVRFESEPFPTWTFDLGGLMVKKTVFLVHGESTVIVRWQTSGRSVVARPLIANRDHHALQKKGHIPQPPLHIFARGRFEPSAHWYENTEYLVELERGFDFKEDLWSPGAYHLEDDWLVASTDPSPWDRARVDEAEARERARRRQRDRTGDFVVRRRDGYPTIIAGYPWFADWGRDTMIALPGILLRSGRLDEAREVLRGFVGHMSRGVIPNRFPEVGEKPEYNTADATFWMFVAMHRYLEKRPGERDIVRAIAREVFEHHRRGTHHGIVIDPADGLVIAGGEGTQLTWMDAKVNGVVATPRHGKAVEINALYYNALRIAGEDAEADRVKSSFQAFWNPARGCLFDVLGDPKIRPNQIFAVGLPYSPLDPEQARAVVDVVERELVTPYGLRTLARGEPGYIGRYEGDSTQRDMSYHQGAVWPWLLGLFVDAYLRVHGTSPEVKRKLRHRFDPLLRHMDEGCIGHVAELFDGDEPHHARAAPAQAWSLAELSRALDILRA